MNWLREDRAYWKSERRDRFFGYVMFATAAIVVAGGGGWLIHERLWENHRGIIVCNADGTVDVDNITVRRSVLNEMQITAILHQVCGGGDI